MNYINRLNPESDFVALDVETTGRSILLDVVTEIGAIRYRGGREMDRFVSLVKPSTPMVPWVERLTGITDSMLTRAPSPDWVAPRLIKFLRRRPLVVHNAAFDIPILERFLSRRSSRPWLARRVLCTLRLSRRLLPHLESRRLSALAAYFDFEPRLEASRFHRADTDAEAAAHVFFRLSRWATPRTRAARERRSFRKEA
ncbi:3'-5' exonuclease [bacterium]|nr:3'-5' exonuclease [bacterium]